MPGDHYLLYANTKDGRRVGPQYIKGCPIKGWDRWIVLKVEPEEVKDFFVVIKTKNKYNEYTDVLEMDNVPFEYNN